MVKDYSQNETCKECGKEFTYNHHGDIYPGGKEREYIYCPYCHATNGSKMTSGFVNSYKIEEE
ncbi:hypothetical protein G7058_00280 [Jeotgalibaca porci]|uniref:Uncharacterized protein n=1 Tax=Jeotgalibaca porci TaxID=1868793 RepID=A0A6G7WEB8_9LACT|nr:hypothetical protein [Jeotgalibaca porci]QIK50634.1 hypothetical protein G7058_00280 [Jeotgalibaca porci]